MEVKLGIQFIHEVEGRVYHFAFPNGFPAQEGIAVVEAVLMSIKKQIEAQPEQQQEEACVQGEDHAG